MPEVILTRPDYEEVTRYLYVWTQKLISFADKKKWTVTDLNKSRANRADFTASVKKALSPLILLHGHGNYTTFTGHDGEILIEEGKNEEILKNTNTYAFSCETAKTLGPSAVRAGAKSYIGYDEVFVFYQTEGKEAAPLKDRRAARFLEPALEVSYSLLSGKSPQTAWKNSQKAFKNNIETLSSSKSKEAFLVRYLLWDRSHQLCLTK